MYFNDVHIIYYVLLMILGAFIGKFVNWANYRLSNSKKVISSEFFKKQKQYNQNYFVILANVIIYVALLYKFGIKSTFIANLELIKYLILTPMLLSVFAIDFKLQIIPNRLNLTIFELGLIIAFSYGWSNIAITINMLLGMLAGGGIFLLIAVISKFIFGKDSVGFGDVKLMGALGLFFGLQNIVLISVLAFLIGAIGSIAIMIIKRKGADTYIPFGPFIVIASIITIFVPFSILFTILMKIFTLGMY